MTNNPLLTIAIPTYNRAQLLRLCLDRIIHQAQASTEEIEIIVSNNASTDNTKEVALSYLGIYPSLKYSENAKNYGSDFNIAKCFRLARADYVWIFSDDDLLLPRAIERMIPLLKRGNLGIIALSVNIYRGSFDESAYPYEPLSFKLYDNPQDLAREVHFWLSYITGVIISKKIASERGICYPNDGCQLIQLGWVIPALFSNYLSARVESALTLTRSQEILDFKLFHVFGKSYPLTLNYLCNQRALPIESKEMLIDLIITIYFPQLIHPDYRYTHGERPFLILGKAFWKRKAYWSHLIPMFVLRALYDVSIKTGLPLSSKIKSLASRFVAYRNRQRI